MSKGDRRRSARERLAAERARQAERARRRRMTAITVGAAGLVALVVGIGVYAVSSDADRSARATAYTGALAPISRDSSGAIVMARAAVTAPLLEIFEDFQCPVCKS